jgi:hypothetical protein
LPSDGLACLGLRLIAAERRDGELLVSRFEGEIEAADVAAVPTADARTVFDVAVLDMATTGGTFPGHERTKV